jgi:hypothetical protein
LKDLIVCDVAIDSVMPETPPMEFHHRLARETDVK